MSLEVVRARGRRPISRFVALPWTLYDKGRHPQWIPPLRAMVRDSLDARRNPFYQTAERELFLAFRDGRPVGRIAAIHNRRHNEFHDERVGFFGFFESTDDPEVARALVHAAGSWLAEKGLERMRGPMSPSTNHECGLLVDGFDLPPTFMTPWNPPYYDALLTGAGLERAKDLLAFHFNLEGGFALPERYARVIARARGKADFRFRLLDLSDFPAEAERAWEVYNSAWERNWGFVPMSRAEWDHMGEMLRHLLLEEFAYFAEVGGEPVAFVLGLPDYNVTLRRNPGGRLFPLGLLRLLRDRTKLRTGRLMLLGIKERFRNRSIYFLMMDELHRRAHAYGATAAEASWILEDNEPLLSFFREAGMSPTKRWRIYEAALSPVA